jgi:Spy/CpxP family protein refolding chaperone
MKRRILFTFLVLSLALNVGVVGSIGYHLLRHGEGPRSNAEFRHHMQRALKLTDEQANTLEKDHAALEASLQPVKTTLENKRMELLSLLDSEQVYTPKIDALIGSISELQITIEKNVIQHSFVLKKSLTPEQQRRFNALFRKGFMKKHPGPGPLHMPADKMPF